MLTEQEILNKPLSYSGIKKLLKSPYHYLISQQKGYESTPDTIFGDAVHTMLLEPDEFYKKFIVIDKDERPEPDKTMASKANKEWKKELEEKAINEKKDVIDNIQFNILKAMVKTAKKEFEKYIEFSTAFEQNIEDTIIYDGINSQKVRGRVDLISDTFVADYKTTQDASPEAFGKACANYMYHMQGALYIDIVGVDTFVFLTQEKEKPYLCAIYMMQRGSEEYNKGVELYKKGCEILAKCKIENTLQIGYREPNNKTLAKNLVMPKWALR